MAELIKIYFFRRMDLSRPCCALASRSWAIVTDGSADEAAVLAHAPNPDMQTLWRSHKSSTLHIRSLKWPLTSPFLQLMRQWCCFFRRSPRQVQHKVL